MRAMLEVIAGLLAISAAIPYLIDIVKGRTKPNIVSWFTWTILLSIATVAAFTEHKTGSAILTLGDAIGCALTVLLGLKYGIAKMSLLDGACQLGAVIGLVLWFMFDSPAIAIFAAIIIDTIAAIPTIRHSWLRPLEETAFTFGIFIVAALLTIVAVKPISVVGLAFPIYLLLVNGTIYSVILYRRKHLNLQATN